MNLPTPAQAPPDPLATFLQTLGGEGMAVVDRSTELVVGPSAVAAWQVLEQAGRGDLPGDAPDRDETAGLWAAQLLFFACQAIVCRDLDTDEVRPRVLALCPVKRSPAADYSADVCLRHLPEVAKLARRLAAADPVNSLIQELAAAWPLSAAGVEGVEFHGVESFWDHPTLRRFFVDRVLSHGTTAALRLPAVADAVRAAIGAHHDLAPPLAVSLNAEAPQ